MGCNSLGRGVRLSNLPNSANNSNPAHRPLIAVTLGDPAGIGPEIVARVVTDARVRKAARLVIIGPAKYLPEGLRMVQAEALVSSFADGEDVVAIATTGQVSVTVGVASREAGLAALVALRVGSTLAKARLVDALVTAPVCKQALHLAGEPVEGQTELLARWDGTQRYEMIALAKNMRVMLLSRHLPLRQALDKITTENVLAHLHLLDESMRALGFETPSLGLAGLNPHAGENGVIGTEEQSILQPAVAAARRAGLVVSDPQPPDTIFIRAARGEFDAVLALYHDQAFIPLKLAGAAPGVEPLTTIAGLTYLRVSPAHGTAFDIAGKHQANPSNMIAAVLQAASWLPTRAPTNHE